MTFVELTENSSAEAAEQTIYDELTTAFAGWEYADSSLEAFVAKPIARLWSAVMAQDAVMGEEAFRGFGETVVGVAPILAAPATVDATLTAIDNAGYTIPQGTQFTVASSGNVTYGFETTAEVTIAPGSTVTGTGELTLSALIAGTEANGLTADAVSVDTYAWISEVELEGTTSGGVDAETPAEYLDRLRTRLQLLTPRPIIERDFAVLALTIAGVARAVAVDGWNPDDETDDNERTVFVAVVDEDGAALSSDVKDAVDDYLQSLREVNFEVYVGDAEYTAISVTTTVVSAAGYDPDDVEDAVEAALTAYFSPANWGLPLVGDPAANGGWVNQDDVRYLEIAQVINSVAGVDYVSALTFKKAGGTLATTDLTLDGAAPLTTVGTLSVTAT